MHADDHDWDGDSCRRCPFDFVEAAALSATGAPFPPCRPPTRVVNLANTKCDVRVDRETVWGNPFKEGRDGTRAHVIARYEEWLRRTPTLMARLPELRGKTLGCWCWPKTCHADVLARLADEEPMLEENEANDKTGQPPSDDDIAEAREVLCRAAVKHIALIPPAIAVQLPNLIRCLDELTKWRRPATVPTPAVTAPTDLPTLPPDPTVLILDTETTGVNKEKDEIVELCIQFGFDTPEGIAPSETLLVKPSIPIPEDAAKIHGITDEHVKDAPAFAACAEWLSYQFEQAQVIVGYNIGFDLEMLAAAFRRAKIKPPDFDSKIVIDAYHLWRAKEPRKLSDAYAAFIGGTMDNAHSAAADVQATGRITLAMLERYGLLGKDWTEIQLVADPDRAAWLGPSRHVQWRAGKITFAFGKYSGTEVTRVDAGFLEWVIGKDFPAHVKLICRAVLAVVRKQRTAAQFVSWCTSQWPPPAEPAGATE